MQRKQALPYSRVVSDLSEPNGLAIAWVRLMNLSWARPSHSLPFVASFVLVIVASAMAVQAQPNGRGRGETPPANGRGGGPPEWAESHKDFVSVPEPATLVLLAVGAGGLAAFKGLRNRRNRNR